MMRRWLGGLLVLGWGWGPAARAGGAASIVNGTQTEQMAQGVLTNLETELSKAGEDEEPNASMITTLGDLLLDNVPQIAEALASLFATPAVGRR